MAKRPAARLSKTSRLTALPMARIRTIKPELPQSESMGRVCREARLTFVLLLTVVDDYGKARASSRMLASLLYPYDDDAPGLIEGWLGELEREDCVQFYKVDGNTYLRVTNFTKHQKVDRPTASKIPDPRDNSRMFARPREASSTDQDQYQYQDHGSVSVSVSGPVSGEGDAPPAIASGHTPAGEQQDRGFSRQAQRQQKRSTKGTRLPDDWTITEELRAWAADKAPGLDIDHHNDRFGDHWRASDRPTAVKRDWSAAWRNWMRDEHGKSTRSNGTVAPGSGAGASRGSGDRPASRLATAVDIAIAAAQRRDAR